MNDNIQIQLITLTTGGRLLRLEDPATGLSVERKLDPAKPLVSQKAKLTALFEKMLQSELAVA
jgi:hypothetical protein